MTPPTPNWMKEDPDNHWDSDDSEYEEQPQTINAEAQAGASQLAPLVTSSSTPSAPVYNPNDPLRYFLENGEIAQDEYDKWKLVKEEPQQREDHHQHHKRKTPDYGPGYNSDNDTDSDGFETTADGSILVYGTGYSKQFNDCNYRDKRIFDPWNPTPDATDDRRYTKIATDHTFMLSRLTCLELGRTWNQHRHQKNAYQFLRTQNHLGAVHERRSFFLYPKPTKLLAGECSHSL